MCSNNQESKQNNASAFLTLGAFRSDQITVSVLDYLGELRQNWHRHEDFILALLLKGHVREEVGCRDVLANPLDVGIKAPGIRHTDRFWSEGGRIIRISLSHSLISDLKSKSLIRERWNWTTNSLAIRPFLRVGHSILHNKSSNAEVCDGICEILAALLPVKSDYSARHAPLWLRHAKERLVSSYADGIRLTHLAEEANVHPVYFARQFRRFFGCSVGRYVRRLQLQSVTSLLASHKYSLAQIACQAGFSDQAHMTRILTAEFGITPGYFRDLLV